MLEPPKFIGLGNYIRLFFADDVFLIAVKNTFVFAAITGPFSYFLSLLLAWMINEFRPVVRAIFTLLFYAPFISGNAFMVWQIFFSSDLWIFKFILMNLNIINSQYCGWKILNGLCL